MRPGSAVRIAMVAARAMNNALHSFRNEIIDPRPIIKLISKHYYSFGEAIMSARETAELLLLVGRLVQTEGYDGELSPAQWMALRFFARANSFSRTPSAFA